MANLPEVTADLARAIAAQSVGGIAAWKALSDSERTSLVRSMRALLEFERRYIRNQEKASGTEAA